MKKVLTGPNRVCGKASFSNDLSDGAALGCGQVYRSNGIKYCVIHILFRINKREKIFGFEKTRGLSKLFPIY